MGDSQKISSLVTGGAASAGPPLGPALGPLGVNIMEIINAINEKTKDFEIKHFEFCLDGSCYDNSAVFCPYTMA